MFRLRHRATDLWYTALDDRGKIIWTEYKKQSLIFPPEKREFWEGDEDIEDYTPG